MKSQELESWIKDLNDKIPAFLKKMEKGDGAYKYSLSGDLADLNSGLANTIFALKIAYMMNLEVPNIDEKIGFIYKFYNKGKFSDPYIKRRSRISRIA